MKIKSIALLLISFSLISISGCGNLGSSSTNGNNAVQGKEENGHVYQSVEQRFITSHLH